MPDKLGRTAMFYAVLYNQEEILEYFISKQANCNVMLVYFYFQLQNKNVQIQEYLYIT